MRVQVPLIPLKEKHWSSSGKDTAPGTAAQRWSCGDAGSSPARCSCSLAIRHTIRRAHDVAETYLLAMQESRVQFPLGALDEQDVGKPGIPPGTDAQRRSRAHEIAGSNPAVLTDLFRCTRVGSRDRPVKPTWRLPHRWFESSHRSLSEKRENGRSSQLAMAAASKAVER